MNTDALTAAPAGGGFLERYFKLSEHGTNVRTEMVAGLTTFLTMAYIIFINPSILGDAGMPKGAVFVSGCLFLLVTLTGLREQIIKGIPHSLRVAITVGIGMFLAIIALKSAGIVAASKATYVTLGDLHQPSVVLATIGFFTIVALDKLKVRWLYPARWTA